MAKLKVVILVILAIVLVDFAMENSQLVPMIKLFKHQVGEVPTYLLTYASLGLGLLIGWAAHGLRIRRKRREAEVAAALAQQQQQESQTGHGG
jgi:uncharacterized integral membrane protein